MNVVLVIEDNTEIREVLEEMIRADGTMVESASDGAQGWARVGRAPSPCLILLDLKMPVMDGIEFLKLRNADSEIARIPVIMLTGSVELEGRDRELNFQGFVKKPFDPDALSRLVRQYCD
jgi:two-component system, chemotaxis family, chemotaxis protein CheY